MHPDDLHEPSHEPRVLKHHHHPGTADVLAKNVQRRRYALKLTQIKLAHRAHIKVSKMRAIEWGNGNPTLGELIRLGVALDVSVRDLFTVHHAPPAHH